MNINKLQKLVSESKLNKVQIAERCGFTRVTLDNALQGADVKISTIESLAGVLGVSVGYFFEEEGSISQSNNGNSNVLVGHDNNGHIAIDECKGKLENAQREIEHLKEVIDGKNQIIEEKERLINVLMNK